MSGKIDTYVIPDYLMSYLRSNLKLNLIHLSVRHLDMLCFGHKETTQNNILSRLQKPTLCTVYVQKACKTDAFATVALLT
jgi:hypothetical protein